MRNLTLVVCFVAVCSLITVAQDHPKAEIFGGYQYTNVSDGTDRHNFNGWNAAVTAFPHKYVGLTADFSGAYGSPFSTDVKLHNFLFGPTFRFPLQKATPFAHALFGASHVNIDTDPSISDHAFSFAFGGGLDVSAGHRLGLRLAQLDYLGTRFRPGTFAPGTLNHFRYSTGLVLKF